MRITQICRVFFHWYEWSEIIKFEDRNPDYKCIHKDTDGVTYEYRADWVIDSEEIEGIKKCD